jgi:histidine phosphotransfer protein HptB
MDQAVLAHGYIYSRLASDPDLSDIVDMFVDEMPGRVEAIRKQCTEANWNDLQRTAHQLKGAAGSYGFDALSPSAGRVEAAIRQHEPEDRVRAAVEELISLCNRTRPGVPGP